MQQSNIPVSNIHSSMLVCIDHGGNKESLLKNNDFSMITNIYFLEGLYAGPLVSCLYFSLWESASSASGHQEQESSLL